jgi:hypothetical protein
MKLKKENEKLYYLEQGNVVLLQSIIWQEVIAVVISAAIVLMNQNI